MIKLNITHTSITDTQNSGTKPKPRTKLKWVQKSRCYFGKEDFSPSSFLTELPLVFNLSILSCLLMVLIYEPSSPQLPELP